MWWRCDITLWTGFYWLQNKICLRETKIQIQCLGSWGSFLTLSCQVHQHRPLSCQRWKGSRRRPPRPSQRWLHPWYRWLERHSTWTSCCQCQRPQCQLWRSALTGQLRGWLEDDRSRGLMTLIRKFLFVFYVVYQEILTGEFCRGGKDQDDEHGNSQK